MDNFWEKIPNCQVTLNFVGKTLFFLLSKNENVLISIQSYVKIMTDGGIRIDYIWFPNRGNTPHRYNIQGTNDFSDSLRVMGKISEKKTPTTDLNILLSKLFWAEKHELSKKMKLPWGSSLKSQSDAYFNCLK